MVNRLLTGFVKVNTSPTAESQSKRGSHYEEANSHGILELAAWFRLEQHRRKRLNPGPQGLSKLNRFWSAFGQPQRALLPVFGKLG